MVLRVQAVTTPARWRKPGRVLAWFLFTVWCVVTVAFVSVYSLPGDPARNILGQRATQETIEEFRKSAKLDAPLPVRYLHFMARAVILDFGDSLSQRRPVSQLIKERFLSTATLVALSLIWMLALGAALPILLRLSAGPFATKVADTVLTVFGIAPAYVMAVLLIGTFSATLGWIPAVFDPQRALCWLLPVAVLAAYPTSLVYRLLNSALRDSLRAPFALRARALGLEPWRVLLVEALRPSMAAPLAAFANGLAFFVTGTFFVEAAFGIPGLGSLTYDAVRNKDIPLLVGLCLCFSITISAVSVSLQLLQEIVDPRVKRGLA